MMKIAEQERAKYEMCWADPAYHAYSPGAKWAEMFMEMTKARQVIDLGCGAGAGGKRLMELGVEDVSFLDQVYVEGVPEPFIQQPLWEPLPGTWDYGYCCDVMEHLPKEFTMLAASNMIEQCMSVFFSISFEPDHFGGGALHLTVENFTWWRDRFREIGTVLEARDMVGEGVFLVER
jgi:hypothetical protein